MIGYIVDGMTDKGYIAEERDSGRLLKACYEQLKAGAGRGASDDRLAALESKLDAVCAAVEGIQKAVGVKANGKPKAKASR